MIREKTIRLLVVFCLITIILCAASLPSIKMIITNFPEIFFGQVALSNETKPPDINTYKSAESILNQVELNEIERARYIAIYDDVLFWDPQYVGYQYTELREDEIITLMQLLSKGHLFQPTSEANSYECVMQSGSNHPKLELCPEGKQYMENYLAFQQEAEKKQAIGVLQFYLESGQLAEIRVYPGSNGLAYSPHEIGGDWWFNGISDPSPLINELQTRLGLSTIPVLWPELTADQANRRAARIIGNKYQPALEFIQNSPVVREIFGSIKEIRPAVGNNYFSSWMDSTSVFLTFRIMGIHGGGAAIVQGYDCFDLQMIFKGIPLDDGNSYVCP